MKVFHLFFVYSFNDSNDELSFKELPEEVFSYFVYYDMTLPPDKN